LPITPIFSGDIYSGLFLAIKQDPHPKTSTSSDTATGLIRLIKKYPNRRLYDTQTSSYITLNEVKNLVIENKPLKVIDAKTEEDLTRSIFLQIILEEESGGIPMFSEAALANLIKFYGHSMQALMGNYLEKNVQTFLDFQHQLTEQSQQLTPEIWKQMLTQPNPFLQNLMLNYTEQSKQILTQMQEQMLNAVGIKR
jgi:polyhydroxyalkanoate synthesis repressor PhaR